MKNLTPTETVNQIGRLNLSGNVIPANWWHHIKTPTGKPDSTAIVLLSEIIYWYRPNEIRDEFTGESKGWRKRFQGDKLQRSYQSFADQFGFTKRMVADALKRLKSKGIITLELRTMNTSIGTCSNVLFIEPVPGRIQEITNATQLVNNQPDLESVSAIEHKKKRDKVYIRAECPIRKSVKTPTLKCKTYTEITTENKKIYKHPIIPLTKKYEFDLSTFEEKPSESVWKDYLEHRKNKKAKLTETALNRLVKKINEANALGYSTDDVLAECMLRNWQGFDVSWLENSKRDVKPQLDWDDTSWANGLEDILCNAFQH